MRKKAGKSSKCHDWHRRASFSRLELLTPLESPRKPAQQNDERRAKKGKYIYRHGWLTDWHSILAQAGGGWDPSPSGSAFSPVDLCHLVNTFIFLYLTPLPSSLRRHSISALCCWSLVDLPTSHPHPPRFRLQIFIQSASFGATSNFLATRA